jgi:hypothetical protein
LKKMVMTETSGPERINVCSMGSARACPRQPRRT